VARTNPAGLSGLLATCGSTDENGNAGIEVKGWHTLRHSYTTLLRQNNGDPRVVQGLLRHNSIKVTMDIYDEAMSDEKQMAHRKVLRLVTRKQDRTVTRTATETGTSASA
jgi:site-specific recombinase XerD